MTTPNNNNSQMHSDIMVAGSKDRPPMLATGRYAQWQSCSMIYVDTKPNMKELKKCIFNETYENTLPENRAYIDAKAKAIHMILSGIEDEIYSTVDACKTTQEMWTAIKRLQQDGESIESYYSRFYKTMNEMVRIQLEVATVQVNVQFLQQLQPEWSRFMVVVKQTIDLDKESYHKLFDILKQYQNEVNEIRAEKIARNENPLALVVDKRLFLPQGKYDVMQTGRERQHFEESKSINDTYVIETVDSNVIPDHSDMCNNEFEDDHNANDNDED
nr:hypothetical protein [Tanacetum cinerariifolium]